jgi:hypothetical protein
MHKLQDKGGVALTDRTTRVRSGYLFKEAPIGSTVSRERLLALGSQGTHVRLDLQPEEPRQTTSVIENSTEAGILLGGNGTHTSEGLNISPGLYHRSPALRASSSDLSFMRQPV